MRHYSFESILSAVGQVLDLAEARSFTIGASDAGLHIEMLAGEGATPQVIHFGLADLLQLLEWSTSEQAPAYERSFSADEGVLRHFLEQHSQELVGSHS